MQLHIRHETLYSYKKPVKHSVQNLRLTPRRDPWQRALNWQIVAPGRRHMQVDAYGNVVHLLTLDQPHHEIRIVVQGLVETQDEQRTPFADEGPLSPLAYLAETSLTRSDSHLREFAGDNLSANGNRLESLIDLSAAICGKVAYETGATQVYDSATQAFERGRGVCQDHAHIFVACARSRGIPARYVSGYLYAGEDSRVASHAWADAWLGPELGWASIDVTNRARTDGRHCRLAVGRDYLDACPVRGVRRGGADEQMSVSVNVSQSAQQQ